MMLRGPLQHRGFFLSVILSCQRYLSFERRCTGSVFSQDSGSIYRDQFYSLHLGSFLLARRTKLYEVAFLFLSVARYEDIRPLLIAVSQRNARLISAQTQDSFTEILLRKESEFGEIGIQIRLFRNKPSKAEISFFEEDLRLLGLNLGIAVLPTLKRDETRDPTIIHMLGYGNIIEKAIELGLIESGGNLEIDADELSKQQADLYHDSHPLAFSRFLLKLSNGTIPSEVKSGDKTAWDLLEDVVFLILKGFELRARREGHTKPFEHKPEGFFIINGSPGNIAAMFDCKGSTSGRYKMDKDDELRFIDYINGRKQEILTLEKADLRFFIIFAADFTGDLEKRTRSILAETGVHLCVIPIEPFADFCLKIRDRAIMFDEICDLIQWPHLLSADRLDGAEFNTELVRLDKFSRRY